ncbi:hypothetical protein VTK73DRAFT_9835 [Phialemonium thermophilum]|uniref:Uncharacterized protein n=1 Tax=Phialemonium thermophilum TaxID=223376 RepID=A0ABR3VZX8_9PEZI
MFCARCSGDSRALPRSASRDLTKANQWHQIWGWERFPCGRTSKHDWKNNFGHSFRKSLGLPIPPSYNPIPNLCPLRKPHGLAPEPWKAPGQFLHFLLFPFSHSLLSLCLNSTSRP